MPKSNIPGIAITAYMREFFKDCTASGSFKASPQFRNPTNFVDPIRPPLFIENQNTAAMGSRRKTKKKKKLGARKAYAVRARLSSYLRASRWCSARVNRTRGAREGRLAGTAPREIPEEVLPVALIS